MESSKRVRCSLAPALRPAPPRGHGAPARRRHERRYCGRSDFALRHPMNALSAWLEELGLARYAEPFAAQDIGLDVLPDLDEADLKELGVASLGDRKRLLKAIAALRPAPPAAASASPPAVLRPQEAERRQLTVMFCDMV